MAQWITHPSPKGKIAGSNPVRDIYMSQARLAQMVERMTLNHVVAGSIPAVGAHILLSRTYTYGGLAQSEEHVVRNDEAPGSKPGISIYKEYIYIYVAAEAQVNFFLVGVTWRS